MFDGNGELLDLWFAWLGLPKHDEAWHRTDLAEELAELGQAKGFVAVWSERADVVFTVARARWSGHNLAYPFGWPTRASGLVYMLPKYTLRWLLFRMAGRRLYSQSRITEVRNPANRRKLRTIAEKHGIDPVAFESECRRLTAWWPLLK